MSVIQNWWVRHLSDPQIVLLFLCLVFAIAVITLAGDILAPIIAALVVAYVLDGGMVLLKSRGMSRALSLIFIYFGFILIVTVVSSVSFRSCRSRYHSSCRICRRLLRADKAC